LTIFDSAGVEVNLYADGRPLKQFEVAGNPESMTTYLKSSNHVPVEISIPGYTSYIAALFGINENQWRNKMLFSSNYRTIKSLEYTDISEPDHSFTLIDSDGFLKPADAQKIDTATLFQYLQIYEYFEADGFIDRGEYERFDSLEKNTEPVLRISIDDIDDTFDGAIRIYGKIPDDPYVFGITKEGQRFVIIEEKWKILRMEKQRLMSGSKNP
jgi:hypothetical protein